MSRSKFEFTRFITPVDLVAVLIILAGILIALYFNEIEYILIGTSISGLGLIALIMWVRQRINDTIKSIPRPSMSPSQPNFRISVKKEKAATHQVIENFDETMKESSGSTEKSYEAFNEDGFRVIRKVKNEVKVPEIKKADNEEENNQLEDLEASNNLIEMENKENELISDVLENQEFANHIENLTVEKNPSETMHSAQIAQNELVQESLFSQAISEVEEAIESQDKDTNYRENLIHKEIQHSIEVLMEEAPTYKDEPRKEFEYLVSRLLTAIKSIGNSKTVCFMLYNPMKSELGMESYITEVPTLLKEAKKIKISNDIVSQIARTGKPEILSGINHSAELDLIPYYKEQSGTSSFIGIPVYYNESVLGIVCADSNDYDAYDSMLVGYLAQFSKIISSLFRNFVQKYDLIQASKTLDAINVFHSMSNEADLNFEKLNNSLINSINEMFDCDKIGVVAWDDNIGGWHINAIYSKTQNVEQLLGVKIDLAHTVIGRTLEENSSFINNFKETGIWNIYENEEVNDNKSFVTLPMNSGGSIFGAVFLETNMNNSFSTYNQLILETLVEQAAQAYEKVHYLNVLAQSALFDPSNGIYNPTAFSESLNKEIAKCNDYKIPMCVCLFSFDSYASFDPNNHPELLYNALNSILELLRSQLKPYEFIGQLENNIWAIILMGQDGNHTRFRIEKLRNEIANTLIDFDGKRYNLTASFGIAEMKSNSNSESMIEQAFVALSKSLNLTNSVSVFS